MILDAELEAVQRGEKGEAMKKILETVILYGEALDAKRMVKITGEMGHAVFGSGTVTWLPVFDLMQEWLDAGLVSSQKLSTDPRGYDPKVPANIPQKLMFRYIFSAQKRLEKEYRELGIKDDNAYTCTAYMPQVGNVPKKGDVLGWAESSAVVYVNSVLGARCNRNSGVIEIMNSILGYVPEFGFLTDDGRKADWIIEVRTKKRPDPQILGSAIGLKVIEEVPYIKGLDKWLGTELNQPVKDYLKDMGAASASNGSVGLFHVDSLTPEAVEQGESLIREGAETYIIDDEELRRVQSLYPVPWDDEEGNAEICFIGCPHMSLEQIQDWTRRLEDGLQRNRQKKLNVATVFTAAPDVAEAFRQQQPETLARLRKIGVTLSSICPLSYTSNPLVSRKRIITCSNKLRYYSHARFYSEEELVEVITKGGR